MTVSVGASGSAGDMTLTAMAFYRKMKSLRQPDFCGGEDGFHSIAITEPIQPDETSVQRAVITCILGVT